MSTHMSKQQIINLIENLTQSSSHPATGPDAFTQYHWRVTGRNVPSQKPDYYPEVGADIRYEEDTGKIKLKFIVDDLDDANGRLEELEFELKTEKVMVAEQELNEEEVLIVVLTLNKNTKGEYATMVSQQFFIKGSLAVLGSWDCEKNKGGGGGGG